MNNQKPNHFSVVFSTEEHQINLVLNILNMFQILVA